MVTYGEAQEDIIKKGFEAIKEVLCGTDQREKASLLLCLDKYLDPYFGLRLAFEHEIFTLMEQIVTGTDPISIKEDALNLLTSFAGPPFPVLESNIDQIEQELLSEVKYAIHMNS